METKVIKLTILVFIALQTLSVHAQEEEQPEKSNDHIAKELANPNTTLGAMAFPIDFTFYNGDIPDANEQFATTLNFQPSLPIPLSPGFNLYVRPLVPFILTTPTVTPSGQFDQKGFNLGNISADVAVGKTFPSKTIGIVGAFAGFPTATDESIRSKQVTVGPEFMVAQLFSWGVIGAMFNHAWGVGNLDDNADGDFSITENNPRRASVTAGQYFYIVHLKNAWQITGQPTWAYNHSAEKGDRFTFPIAAGVNKVTKVGKVPVKLSMQYWYYLATPDTFGPKHQIRVQIAPVIKLPW